MFRTRQLAIMIFIGLLLSCNSNDKQKEQANLPRLTNDTFPSFQKRMKRNLDTTRIIVKKPVAFKIQKTLKTVAVNSYSPVQTLLANDFKRIEKGFQNFVIDSGLDTTLLCEEGTKLQIRQSSFLVASTLTEVKGRIIFQVKEFYKLSDILSARLTTHSNDSILETGGMLFIQATFNGQACKLKENAPIEISFPFTEKKDSMLLFSGSWPNQKINWELFPQNEARQKEVIEEIALFPGGNIALNNFIFKNIVYPDSLADMGIGGVVQMDFAIDEMGRAKDVNFKNQSRKGFRDAIINTFSKMPRWKPAKRNGMPIKSTYSQSITFDNGELNDTIFKNDFEASINDTNINKLRIVDIKNYIFSMSKLGWINCDRFYKSSKQRTDFYVECGNYTELDIKLIFHSFKAILDNYNSKTTYKFSNIPNDEAITVVVVKKINNDTFISLTESNTNLKSINKLAFEKVTMDKLKQKLEQLNNIR